MGVFVGDAVFPFDNVEEVGGGLVLVGCWHWFGFGDSSEIDSIVFKFFGYFGADEIVGLCLLGHAVVDVVVGGGGC